MEKNGMKFELHPYILIDGIPTLRNSELVTVWNKMVDDGTTQQTFLDGSVQSAEDFLHEMKNPDSINMLLTHDGVLCGLVRLNQFRQYTAHCHVLKIGDLTGQDVVDSAKFTMNKLLHLRCSDRYMFDVLYGLVSVKNKPMLALADSMGMVVMGIIPDAVYDYWNNESCDGVFMYCTRRETNESNH
jgi:hypothetical protein